MYGWDFTNISLSQPQARLLLEAPGKGQNPQYLEIRSQTNARRDMRIKPESATSKLPNYEGPSGLPTFPAEVQD